MGELWTKMAVLNSYKTKKSELLQILLYRSDFSVYFRTAWAPVKGDVGLLCGQKTRSLILGWNAEVLRQDRRYSAGPDVLLWLHFNRVDSTFFKLLPHINPTRKTKAVKLRPNKKRMSVSLSSLDQTSDTEKILHRPGETSSVWGEKDDDGDETDSIFWVLSLCLRQDWLIEQEMVLDCSSQLSLPPVTYLQLPERLPTFALWVASFGELLCLIGRAGFRRGTAGRIRVAHWRMLPEVVQRRGAGGGHVLGRAALWFDAEVEGRQVRRGWGGEGAPSAGHAGNSKRWDKRKIWVRTPSPLQFCL